MPPLAPDRESNPCGDRGAIDRHAVKAMGDLLMLGAWLERRARNASTHIQKGRP
jgi:hypothetical protein